MVVGLPRHVTNNGVILVALFVWSVMQNKEQLLPIDFLKI